MSTSRRSSQSFENSDTRATNHDDDMIQERAEPPEQNRHVRRLNDGWLTEYLTRHPDQCQDTRSLSFTVALPAVTSSLRLAVADHCTTDAVTSPSSGRTLVLGLYTHSFVCVIQLASPSQLRC